MDTHHLATLLIGGLLACAQSTPSAAQQEGAESPLPPPSAAEAEALQRETSHLLGEMEALRAELQQRAEEPKSEREPLEAARGLTELSEQQAAAARQTNWLMFGVLAGEIGTCCAALALLLLRQRRALHGQLAELSEKLRRQDEALATLQHERQDAQRQLHEMEQHLEREKTRSCALDARLQAEEIRHTAAEARIHQLESRAAELDARAEQWDATAEHCEQKLRMLEVEGICTPTTPPPYFSTPLPTNRVLTVPTPELEQLLAEPGATESDADFRELCALFNSAQRESWPALHRRHAEAFLARFGEPTGTPEHKSLLLTARAHERFWFFGDVHSDWNALYRAYGYVLRQCELDAGEAAHTLIFCGDLIDRGMESLRTVTAVLCLLQRPHPRLRVIFVRGNHDIALSIRPEAEASGRMPLRSSVMPAETLEELATLWNMGGETRELAMLMARAIIRLAEISPCMGEIVGLDARHPDRTLLFTHGGLPHTDLQDQIHRHDAQAGQETPDPKTLMQRFHLPYLETLPGELHAALSRDFSWIRLAERGKRKYVDRMSSGCEMGPMDVTDFRRQHWERTRRAIAYIVRGHDHEDAGFRLYSHDAHYTPPNARTERMQTECGVLTINTMGLYHNHLTAERRVSLAGVSRAQTPAVDIVQLYYMEATPEAAPERAAEPTPAPAPEPESAP